MPAWKSLPSGQLKSICFNKKKAMNNAKYIVTWICLLWLTIGSCVDKFNAHLPESSTRVLIVEGNIISDSTVVFP